MATDDSDDMADILDTHHISDGVVFVNRFSKGWWLAAAICAVTLPPLGVGALAYFILSGLKRAGEDDIPLYANQ